MAVAIGVVTLAVLVGIQIGGSAESGADGTRFETTTTTSAAEGVNTESDVVSTSTTPTSSTPTIPPDSEPTTTVRLQICDDPIAEFAAEDDLVLFLSSQVRFELSGVDGGWADLPSATQQSFGNAARSLEYVLGSISTGPSLVQGPVAGYLREIRALPSVLREAASERDPQVHARRLRALQESLERAQGFVDQISNLLKAC